MSAANVIIMLRADADVRAIRDELLRRGAETTELAGGEARALLAEPAVDAADIPGVAQVLAAPSPHPLVDAAPSVVEVGGVAVGGAQPVLMAGPCAVENEAQIHGIAAAVAAAGGRLLRRR